MTDQRQPSDDGEGANLDSPARVKHNLGPVEPTRAPEAGPGGAPDPAPARRPFPDEDTGRELGSRST